MKQLTYEEINRVDRQGLWHRHHRSVGSKVWLATLRRWRQRSAQRRRLAGLSICLLDDIGITDEQRFEEIGKPFWRA